MQKRILFTWLAANFVIVGVVCWLAGGWYLGWSLIPGLVAELALIMLPNLVLPLVLLRCCWLEPVPNLRDALGWRWHGWRTLLAGIGGVLLMLVLSAAIAGVLGSSIPYQVPGRPGMQVQSLPGLFGLLMGMLLLTLITVAGEETMFRGLVQTQVGARYGLWAGLLLGALLFGLRHLPADIFYAQLWDATPQMWLSRQLQLYSGALVLGGVRYIGRSTYASAIAHGLYFILVLFGMG